MNKKGNKVVPAVVVAVVGVSLAFIVADSGNMNRVHPDVSVTSSVTSAERYVPNAAVSETVTVETGTQDAYEYASQGSDGYSNKTMVTVSTADLVYDHDEEVLAVVDLINQNRTAAGLKPVVYDQNLMVVANTRAVEIASLFSHYRPDGTSCFTALDIMGCNYWCAGENIAYGQRHADWVMRDWMNSASHKDNILYPDYGKVGVGLYEGSDGVLYWVQLFTN